MGNSEVGHLNLGAGRVVPQDLVRISQSIQSGEFYQLPPLVELCRQVAGIRRHAASRRAARPWRCPRPRPSPPCLRRARRPAPCAGHRDSRLPGRPRLRRRHWEPKWCARSCSTCGGLPEPRLMSRRSRGRYFGMDRDRRWERTKVAYDAVVHGVGKPVERPRARRPGGLRARGDRRVHPAARASSARRRAGRADARRRRGDLLQLSLRPHAADRRARLPIDDFDGFDVARPASARLRDDDAVRPDLRRARRLSAVSRWRNIVARSGVRARDARMLRTAETEKYAHVTYFFNGGIRDTVPGRRAVLVPSQKVATYDLAPEMSASGRDRRARAGDRDAASTISSCATTRTATWWATPASMPAVDHGGGDGGSVSGARAAGGAEEAGARCS